MVDFLVNYWWLLVVVVAVIVIAIVAIVKFAKTPSKEQLAKVKEWLLFAVVQAEKELGSGTGQMKLRYVYDMFVTKFPFMIPLISFDTFKHLVDEALDQMKELLNENPELQSYVDKK